MVKVLSLVAAAFLAAVSFAAPAQAAKCNAASQDVLEQAVKMTNQLRAQLGLSRLSTSSELTKAATAHACDMAALGQMTHIGSNGSNVKTRTTRAGYRSCVVAENIAWGYKGVDVVVTGWENSPKHRANMTHRKMKEIGIGLAYAGDTPYWVMVLASPC